MHTHSLKQEMQIHAGLHGPHAPEYNINAGSLAYSSVSLRKKKSYLYVCRERLKPQFAQR